LARGQDDLVTEPQLPGYGTRSLAEVFPSAIAALTGEPGPLAVPPARAVAVLLVDGLGHELLHAHAADAPFLAGLTDLGPLTVGFPSSTVVSLGSLGTGLPPGAHGMLGTSFLVDGVHLDALPWAAPGGKDLRERLVPERVQSHRTVFEAAEAAGIATAVVSARAFRGSGLTRANLRGGVFRGTSALGDLAGEMLAHLGGEGRRLGYGYHGDLDMLGHVHGPGSPAWRLQLTAIDRLAVIIAERLPPGSVLLVTGDHGMVAMDRTYDADTSDDLRAGVAHLAGDARCRYVHAEPGAIPDVLAAWRAVLGADAWVLPADEAVAAGWFGPMATVNRERIGDLVVAARGTAGVIRSVAEARMAGLPGQHGSLSSAEQLVPLLVSGTAGR
jgi:Type I phosphodiesterase / nucleotide pyrophosphatase